MMDREAPNSTTHSADNPQSWEKASDLARGDAEKLEKLNGRSGGGDSGGGAYPNPHTGKDGGDSEGYMGHGGQTDTPYHGPGQLGEKDLGPSPNAPTEKDD